MLYSINQGGTAGLTLVLVFITWMGVFFIYFWNKEARHMKKRKQEAAERQQATVRRSENQ